MRKPRFLWKRKDQPPSYEPSPAEIAAACLAIQADWSEAERQARRHWRVVNGTLFRPNQADLPPEYEIPEVRCA